MRQQIDEFEAQKIIEFTAKLDISKGGQYYIFDKVNFEDGLFQADSDSLDILRKEMEGGNRERVYQQIKKIVSNYCMKYAMEKAEQYVQETYEID